MGPRVGLDVLEKRKKSLTPAGIRTQDNRNTLAPGKSPVCVCVGVNNTLLVSSQTLDVPYKIIRDKTRGANVLHVRTPCFGVVLPHHRRFEETVPSSSTIQRCEKHREPSTQ